MYPHVSQPPLSRFRPYAGTLNNMPKLILMTGQELSYCVRWLYGSEQEKRRFANDLSRLSNRPQRTDDNRRIAEMMSGRRHISRMVVEALLQLLENSNQPNDPKIDELTQDLRFRLNNSESKS